jgi:inhibitor of nuclear factor kappa-B kinase subunit alpha
VFQQDGARSHTARSTIQYLEDSTILFEYIEPNKWPASSPDLNPCDYSVWNELERVLHRRQSFKSLDDLKASLIEAWEQFPQDHIVNAINKFRQRCRDVLKAEGGHIEHFR